MDKLIYFFTIILLGVLAYKIYDNYKHYGMIPTVIPLAFAILGAVIYIELKNRYHVNTLLLLLFFIVYFEASKYIAKKLVEKHCRK